MCRSSNPPPELPANAPEAEFNAYEARSTLDDHNISTGLDDDQNLTEDRPPAYSNGYLTAQSEGSFLSPVTSLRNIDFHKYELPQSTISEDQLTTTTTFPIFTSNSEALIELLHKQAALPPKRLVRIRGTHSEYGASYGPIRMDFDLTLNLLPLIMRAGTDKWNYFRVLPAGKNGFCNSEKQASQQEGVGVEELAQRFCDDPAEFKSITLERKVINWDTEYLEGQIRSVVASTKYQGNITVTFPIAFSKVVVLHKGKESPKIKTSWRETRVKKDNDDDDPTQRYDVVQSIWPYATSPPGSAPDGSLECAVQTEQSWWQIWKVPIRNAVLTKRRGWVTVEDWTDMAMGVKAVEREKEWAASGDWRE